MGDIAAGTSVVWQQIQRKLKWKKRMKKIFRWLLPHEKYLGPYFQKKPPTAQKEQKDMAKKFKLKQDPFFRKDEEGRTIFYPWGYPGEGIYVDGNHHKIAFFLNLFGLLVILFCALGISLEQINIISRVTGYYLFLGILIPAVPFYFLSIHIFKRGKELLVLPKEVRPAPKSFFWALIIPILYINGFVIFYIEEFLLNSSNIPIAFFTFYLLSFIYTMCVFTKILLSRGYYFAD